jgi:peptide/nickel transport system permease protein
VVPADRITNLDATGVADRRVFLLGSDKFGRDVLSRLLHGTRVSLEVALLSLALALLIGVPVGALAALGGRVVDEVSMRTVDGLLAFPTLFLLIALAAVFPGGRWSVIVLLGGTTWMGIARLVRGELASLKERDFVLAVRAMGAGPMWIFFRHLLPNARTPILAAATLQIGTLILAEASISYLGFGIAPPEASWGNLIADGQATILSAWWVAGAPGIAIVVTVIALNVAGDGLRDLLDPRARAVHR